MNNIPNITKNLLIINILAYVATMLLGAGRMDLTSALGLHFFMASDFHLYQLFTYMFLHGGLTHLFFNMFALWMFGRIIENVWGPRKFLFYYISCGIGAGLIQEAAQFCSFYLTVTAQDPSIGLGDMFAVGRQLSTQLNGWTTIGASGAIYAVLLAFGMIFPNERLFIIPFPFPIKAKWLVVGYIAIELFSALSAPGDGVAHTAHLGGMLFGFLMIRYWNRHPDSQYNRSRGQQFFDNLRQNFEQRKQQRQSAQGMHAEEGGRRESDWEYNKRKKEEQEEVDRILDKIRKSGYDSLTKEEKQRLFENRR